jgi:Fur family peroxide stress response transcriptional regulator
MMKKEQVRILLGQNGLKITPQRIAVLEALHSRRDHPTAEEVARQVHLHNPNVATGTIYNILETLVQKGLLLKVKTENDVMRYDVVLDSHHHLYCSDCNRIEDYYNDELTELLEKYFSENQIPGFSIDEVRLNINGRFTDKSKHGPVKKNV